MTRNGSSEEPSMIVADGAYYGKENEDLARENNVTLVTTAVTGVEVPDIYADFELNADGTRVLKCPAGHAPKSCSQEVIICTFPFRVTFVSSARTKTSAT